MVDSDKGIGSMCRYLDDLEVGQSFTSGTVTLSEGDIVAFAGQFDPQPFHTDPLAATSTVFGGLAASGWHTAALTMRLLVDGGLPLAGGIVGLGGEIAWPRPTRSGDTLYVDSEVVDIAPSRSKPSQGVVTVRSTTRNTAGDAVQVLTAKLLVVRRSLNKMSD